MIRCLLLLLCVLLLPLQAAVPPGTDVSALNQGEDIERNYRHRTFCAYKPLAELSRTLKIGSYSAYENPTGLYFRAGESICVTLHTRPERPLRLIIRDFRQGGCKDVYPLQEGENHIVVKNKGLGYVDYRSALGAAAPPISISFRGGELNGIFSGHDSNETWKKLLAKLPAGILDVVGERCHIAYDAEGLRSGNPDKGREMLAVYDRIVELQQQIMGWDAEGIHPGNHMLCRVVWGGYMYADGEGAAFNNSLTAGLSKPEEVLQNAWGIAHELGHVNQLRPDFTWAGMMEVSNNIYSSWCNYCITPQEMRLEHERTANFEGVLMRGGRFDCYINNALVKRQLWSYTGGPDSGIGKVPGDHTGDHFVSVCPLWQLQLYCCVVQGKQDFYPAVFRALRAQDSSQLTHGQLRMNFCRYVAESAGLNLNHFFLHTGMYGVMNRCVPDYNPHMVTVTPEMVAENIRAAMPLPTPDSSVIYYINANNVNIYRDKLPVEPSPDFRISLPQEGGAILIPANKWKNAVAFEVYRGSELVRICLRGLGQQDNASTTVICPPGSTSIRAVQWDGKRYTL